MAIENPNVVFALGIMIPDPGAPDGARIQGAGFRRVQRLAAGRFLVTLETQLPVGTASLTVINSDTAPFPPPPIIASITGPQQADQLELVFLDPAGVPVDPFGAALCVFEIPTDGII